MRKLIGAAVVLLVVVLSAFWLARQPGASVPDHAGLEAVVEPRGRPAVPPDAALLASAQALLGADGRQDSCGPYSLHTDVADRRYAAVCGRLAAKLDEIYGLRYGIRPLGEPAEAIVLFSEIASYRAFASQGGVPLGYAGYALAARGLAVFYAGDRPFESFVTTLAHELTHLVSRRALGINLPPWLSEGLADGIGDTATAEGFRPLQGVAGSEVQARRLRQAVHSGQAGSVERLVASKRGDFDRGVVSYDYEQSALLVRFLLGEPDLAPAFRGFLCDFAHGAAYSPERLEGTLGIGWADLDRRFRAWIIDVPIGR